MRPVYPIYLKNKHLFTLLFCFLTLSPALAVKNITFSVNVSLLVNQSKFNPATDGIFIRGTFNSWETTTPLTAAGNGVYSVTIPLADNNWQEYKYFINTAGADNSGWETNFPITTSGNRRIYIGEKDLTLATVYYNDGEMDQLKSTPHFNIYYTANEKNYIDEFASRIEICYSNMSNALQNFPASKASIYLYKDLDQLHLVCGYPENGPGSIGSAWGSGLITMVGPSAFGLDGALGLFSHEYTHCLIASKTKVTLPAWLNEGVASYYGNNFSTKDWIKYEMNQQGKPLIANVFDGSMGYAYSSIVAYYIIKTKGEAAMAKFIENMNYADIGYANLEALQADWWNFLDVYLDYETKVQVKFSVDMADMIGSEYFNPASDKVFVNLHRNIYDWYSTPMTLESGTIYSVTVPLNRYNFFDYRFSTNSPTAPNGGYELKVNQTVAGTRLLDVVNSNITLPAVKFSSDAVSGLNMTQINNKIKVLKVQGKPWTTPGFSTFKYAFNVLTPTEFNAQKPADALPFDCGFVSADGTVHVSTPTTAAQLAVFKDINKAALYYLCQSYLYYYYQTTGLPLLLKVGFPAYEASLDPTDTDVENAVNSYGGSFANFGLLNNATTFTQNNGWTIAYAFAEFMSAYKNWGFPMIINVTAASFDAAPGWYQTDNLQGLLDDFNRYIQARFLETNESSRIKLMQETEHFRIYTRQREADVNFPFLPNTLENAYSEYSSNYDVKAYGKLTAFTLSDCTDAIIEGISCDPNGTGIGGTAWPTGLHFGCGKTEATKNEVISLSRHELAHAFQGFMPIGEGTQWLGEGFAFFSDGGPFNADFSNLNMGSGFWKQLLASSLERGTTFFGHRPTYEDTKVYPGYTTDYGYKYLGWYLNDFIYRKGGYKAVKDVQMGDLEGYRKIGYPSGQAIMDAMYFDFDVRVRDKKVVTLLTPSANVDEDQPTVNFSWTPLDASVKLDVMISTDKGETWTTIAQNTTATSCSWNAGEFKGEFLVKFMAPEIFNHQTTYGPFYKINLAKPAISFPNGTEYLIAGDTVNISWTKTTIPQYKIEYSGDNAAHWSTVAASCPTTALVYAWIVPGTASGQCKIRISDTSNQATNDESDACFTILQHNDIGGPYLYDKNTVALLHFDNDLKNRSALSGHANGATENLTSDAGLLPDLGKCLKTTNPVTVPHHTNLNLSGDWTIEMWMKLTSYSTGDMYLLTKPGDTDAYFANYTLSINPWWGNIFYTFLFSNTPARIGLTSITPALNEWYHVAFIRDTKKSELRLLIHDRNRTLISDQSSAYNDTGMLLNSKDIIIGQGVNGYIDEVRISNIVRSFSTSGVHSPKADNMLSVYPNPTKGIVRIELQPDATAAEIRVFNTAGQTIFSKTISHVTECTIDLTAVKKGIYYIHVRETGKPTRTAKLIIQ